MKIISFLPCIEHLTIFLDPGYIKIVTDTAHGNNQCVITECTPWNILLTMLAHWRLQTDFLLSAIQAIHITEPETEMMPMCLDHIADFIFIRVQRAGRDFM